MISSVLSLYCVLMVASAIVEETDLNGVDIPETESFVYVVAMASLSSMVAVFYSSLYFFSAHRYIPRDTTDNLRITSDDDSGSVIMGTCVN